MSHQALQTHEAKGHLYYAPVEPGATDWDGLDPYEALSGLIYDVEDDYVETTAEIDDETWYLRLNYSGSGIAPKREHGIDADVLWEFDLTVAGEGQQRGGSYNLSPRFPDMRTPDGDSIDTAFSHVADAGLDAHFQVANMDLAEIHTLLPVFLARIFEAADTRLYDGYFETAVGGRIYELERYVRITRNMAKKLTHTGGVFHSLMLHMSSVEGTKVEYHADNTEAEGYHHQFRYHDDAASELLPTHRYGKQLKAYLTEHPHVHDPDDPLYHHKVGALYRTTLNSGQSVDWSNRHDLVDELDEDVLNVLNWADVPITPGGTTYITDDHFESGEARDEPVPLFDDPTPELEARNEGLLLRTLRDLSSRTDSDVDVLDAVATDGGRHVGAVAAETDWSLSTIYRAIDRMDGLLTTENGHVEFVCKAVAEDVRAIRDRISDLVESGAERASAMLDRELRGAASSAFDEWLARYNAEFDPPDGDERPVVRIGTVLSWLKSGPEPRVADAIDELTDSWTRDGYALSRIQEARVEADVRHGDDLGGRPLRTLR